MEASNRNTPHGRLPIWRALSQLFLDTELDARSYDAIAREVRASGYTADEAHDILWREVYPVLAVNLRSVAGVWDGWPDEWLLARLSVASGARRSRGGSGIVAEIRHCWDEVARRLASGAE